MWILIVLIYYIYIYIYIYINISNEDCEYPNNECSMHGYLIQNLYIYIYIEREGEIGR